MIAKNGAKVVKKNDMCKNTCHFSYFLYEANGFAVRKLIARE